MLDAITIPENKMAPLDAGKFSEVQISRGGEEVEGKEAEKQSETLDLSLLSELAADLEKEMSHNVGLQFAVHEASGRVAITVIEESTGQVIREIPSAEILNLAAKFDEMIGLIFDQKG